MREHTVGKYYTCPCCGKEFYTNATMGSWQFKASVNGKTLNLCSEKCTLKVKKPSNKKFVSRW